MNFSAKVFRTVSSASGHDRRRPCVSKWRPLVRCDGGGASTLVPSPFGLRLSGLCRLRPSGCFVLAAKKSFRILLYCRDGSHCIEKIQLPLVRHLLPTPCSAHGLYANPVLAAALDSVSFRFDWRSPISRSGVVWVSTREQQIGGGVA